MAVTTQHSTLTGPELHEPKGADTASANEVFVADGSGSGSFQSISAYGGWAYNSTSSGGATLITPTAYTLVAPVTAASNLKGFTHNSLGRLTYTGVESRRVSLLFTLGLSSTVGGNTFVALFKNGSILGSPNYEVAIRTGTTKLTTTLISDDVATTNDYYELYIKLSAGDVVVSHAYANITSVPI